MLSDPIPDGYPRPCCTVTGKGVKGATLGTIRIELHLCPLKAVSDRIWGVLEEEDAGVGYIENRVLRGTTIELVLRADRVTG